MNNAAISRQTFADLLYLSKSARNSFENNLKNSSNQLKNSPNSKLWQESVAFWQEQAQSAENLYKKALEEVKFLD
jgi:hypothetical protein